MAYLGGSGPNVGTSNMKEPTWEKERESKMGLGLENTRQRRGVHTDSQELWEVVAYFQGAKKFAQSVREGERGSGEKDWEGKEHAVLHV